MSTLEAGVFFETFYLQLDSTLHGLGSRFSFYSVGTEKVIYRKLLTSFNSLLSFTLVLSLDDLLRVFCLRTRESQIRSWVPL